MLGVRHAVGVSSGTDALLAALMALKIGPGDEVVTSSYSFFATAGRSRGSAPAPCSSTSIRPRSTWMCREWRPRARRRPRQSSRCISSVCLADMPPLMDVARRRSLARGRGCGAGHRRPPRRLYGRRRGDIGCFSFFPSKNLGAFGDAGLVTTSDDALGHALRILRQHGSEPKYFHKVIGGNFRIDALQAAVLRVKAPHLAGWTEGRRRNARQVPRADRRRRD